MLYPYLFWHFLVLLIYISIIWILAVQLFFVEIHISFFIALACNSSRCICIDKVITICIYVWLEVNQVLTRLLTVERLRVFSDSVLLVAITILAYNLTPPSLINGKLSGIETQSFLNNVYGLLSSFFVISFFWLLYTKILVIALNFSDLWLYSIAMTINQISHQL